MGHAAHLLSFSGAVTQAIPRASAAHPALPGCGAPRCACHASAPAAPRRASSKRQQRGEHAAACAHRCSWAARSQRAVAGRKVRSAAAWTASRKPAHFVGRFALDAHGQAEAADFQVGHLAVEQLPQQVCRLRARERARSRCLPRPISLMYWLIPMLFGAGLVIGLQRRACRTGVLSAPKMPSRSPLAQVLVRWLWGCRRVGRYSGAIQATPGYGWQACAMCLHASGHAPRTSRLAVRARNEPQLVPHCNAPCSDARRWSSLPRVPRQVGLDGGLAHVEAGADLATARLHGHGGAWRPAAAAAGHRPARAARPAAGS
jgi:hypothetical protein